MTYAQETTVGLLSYNATKSYEGYTLIYPHNQPNVFLLDNCGEVVHVWEDEEGFRPGNMAYLQEDGSLIKCKRPASFTDDAIWAGGGGAIVEIRSWENELLWSFELNNEDARLHHDIAPMPNGNILMLAWERKTAEEAEALGRLPELMTQGEMWPDYVFEINPATDEIVWEWHAWDHLVQTVDESLPDFGELAANPGRIDINYDDNEGKADWMHTNALDYNAENDQIMISVPTFNEIWVIDHSTTTEQAAGDFGGLANHGGNLIYRVGSPAVYGREDMGEQILHYQHDSHWADDFLPTSHPDYGKIVAFNNRVGADFSSIEIFNSSYDMYELDYLNENGAFPPFNFDNTITHPEPQKLYSTGLSSAQLLPNGNILACSGRFGYIVELTEDNDVVWEYITPLLGGQPVNQGDTLAINNNLTFRATRYPVDYEAFEGKDLVGQFYIEENPIEDYCQRLVSVSMPELYTFEVYPNPASENIRLTWDTGEALTVVVRDLLGREIKSATGRGGLMYLDVNELRPNMYLLEFAGYGKTLKIVIE